jgi:large subunit ribosomal protein L9
MKIILRQDVENLGNMGDIVIVKDGYARNYLIPRSLAYYASPSYINVFESEKKRHMAEMARKKEAAELLASKLSEIQVSVPMKVGEEGRLFGSVTPQMIAHELAVMGFDIDRRSIMIDDAIKSLGVFDVKAKLHPEVIATFKVWIISA